MDNQNILHNDLRLFPKHTVQCQIDILCWESIRDISFPRVSISSVARRLYTIGSQLLSVCSYLRFELQYIEGNSHRRRHSIPFLFSFLVYSPGPTGRPVIGITAPRPGYAPLFAPPYTAKL